MFKHTLRLTAAVVLVIGLQARAPAQDAKAEARKSQQAELEYQERLANRASEEYRQFFKKPETPDQFWTAMNFEIDVGRYGLAAELLKGLLDVTKDTDKDLLAIEEREGLSAFMRLRVVQTWVDDPNPLSEDPKLDKQLRAKIDKEARDNVELLIGKVSKAQKEFLADRTRFKKLVNNLSGNAEDQKYAMIEMRRSGALAIPSLIEELRTTSDLSRHANIITTLVQLGKEVDPALEAALYLDDPALQVELIDVLIKRADIAAVPNLWYLSASPRQAEMVRKEATRALALLLRVGEDSLPSAKVALTREAEKYYQHQVRLDPKRQPSFAEAGKVVVWQWNRTEKQLEGKSMDPSLAEEYHGLRFARQALDLDPTYEPAQVVFLSLALDKGFERAGLDKPLDKGAPAVRELLKVINPDLLIGVLERALSDHRLPVILGTVRALDELSEVRAARPTSLGPPVLVRALNYPDRRVQLAAAIALLHIPGPPPAGAATRIVEVLRRTLTADPLPRALVADGNKDRGEMLTQALKKAGFDTVLVREGRDAMARLRQAADVDVLLIDHEVPNPQLPFLLAQLRADVDTGLLPILVMVPPNFYETVSPQSGLGLRRLMEHYRNVWVVPYTLDPDTLKAMVWARIDEATGKRLSDEERKVNRDQAMDWLNLMATGKIPGYDVRPAEKELFEALHDDLLTGRAIEAVGRMPDAEAQRKLADIVLDKARNPQVRAGAAFELNRHVQQYGLNLTKDQIAAIRDLYEKTSDDPRLKGNLARVVGSMRPNALSTGQRLEEYFPPAPPPAAPPAVPPAKE